MVIRARFWLVVATCVVLCQASLATAAVPPNDTIYPNSTKAFVSIGDAPKLAKNWETTQLYQLFEDPVMKPFSDDLKRQLEDKWLAQHESWACRSTTCAAWPPAN